MDTIKEALTLMMFYCCQNIQAFCLNTNIFLRLTKKIKLKVLFHLQWILSRIVLAIAIARAGGMGIVHEI